MRDENTTRLILFLKKHRAYIKFINNLAIQEPTKSIDDFGDEHSIGSAFTWRTTPQGHEYWQRLSELFYDQYDSLPSESDKQWDDMWEG